MPRRKIKPLTFGELPRGGIPWSKLPGYVQNRVQNRPWDDTEADRFIQKIDRGFFIVRHPETEQRELWISAPTPRLANGISMIGTIEYPAHGHYPGEKFPEVDERLLLWLAPRRPDMNISMQQFMEMKEKIIARIEKEQQDIRHGAAEDIVDTAFTNAGDPAKVGRLERPIKPVAVNGLRKPSRIIQLHH